MPSGQQEVDLIFSDKVVHISGALRVQHHYITDSAALAVLCDSLSQSPVLAIDTEFVRTRTLYPKLGLLQICNGEHIALVDPIEVDDLAPFWALLSNEKIVKVLHACSEDLEVFLHAGNCKPVNLLDSQLVMTFLGHGLSLGYAAMVKHYLDIELDKSESRTDWTKRPLSEKQKEYAKADVSHLFAIYPKLIADIEAQGWLSAAQQESQMMIERKFTAIDEQNLYRNIKMAWKLNPKQLNVLRHLAIWRYERAKFKNQPLSFIAKDPTLMLAAQFMPRNVGGLAHIEGVVELDVRHQGKAIVGVIKKALEDDVSTYPEKIRRLDEYPGYKQIFKKVKHFVADVAEENGLTVESLASKKQINQFLEFFFKLNGAEQQPQLVDILQTWRANILGDKLQSFAENGFR
ncbi:ribonuclease D [Thalassotalea euphylliae]|uniref:ribonuclease D n=1 Tax=Thalassotalea euphylliae TaxID=1655234 RepID=UPI00364248A5